MQPATAPHWGAYRLKFDAQPQSLQHRWPVRQAAAVIPALTDNLLGRATVVVEADAARACVTADYRLGRRTAGDALACIAEQTRQTIAFLAVTTRYNLAIADYVLAVRSPGASGGELAGSLVVMPRAEGTRL